MRNTKQIKAISKFEKNRQPLLQRLRKLAYLIRISTQSIFLSTEPLKCLDFSIGYSYLKINKQISLKKLQCHILEQKIFFYRLFKIAQNKCDFKGNIVPSTCFFPINNKPRMKVFLKVTISSSSISVVI